MTRAMVITEPRGTTYKQFIDFAAKKSRYFSLVWRKGDFPPIDSPRALCQGLKNLVVFESFCNEWPGTKIKAESDDDFAALVRVYRIDEQAVKLLKQTKNLFDWNESLNMPEDLAFYLPDRRCWFVSVSHESMAWIENTVLPVRSFRTALPEIEVRTEEFGGFFFYSCVSP